ncbi:MAG: hypothetical protein GXY68_08620 [Chloroflexi bacterium]|jgi:hypothetical protein|nr:hypothetical protein [Chloroflexota bacterium]
MAGQWHTKQWRFRLYAALATLTALTLFVLGLDLFEMWLIVLVSAYAYWVFRLD